MGFSSSMLCGNDEVALRCVCVCLLYIKKPEERAVRLPGGVENPFLVPPTSFQLCVFPRNESLTWHWCRHQEKKKTFLELWANEQRREQTMQTMLERPANVKYKAWRRQQNMCLVWNSLQSSITPFKCSIMLKNQRYEDFCSWFKFKLNLKQQCSVRHTFFSYSPLGGAYTLHTCRTQT